MKFQLPNGVVVGIDAAFEYDGHTYPSGWLRENREAREALGITEIAPPSIYDERFYFAPGTPKPLDMAKDRLRQMVAAERWARQSQGVNGFKTDTESLTFLNGAVLDAILDPNSTVEWKSESGYIDLTAQQVIQAAQAVRAFIQSYYSAERVHLTAIEALASFDDVVAYDVKAGWPE